MRKLWGVTWEDARPACAWLVLRTLRSFVAVIGVLFLSQNTGPGALPRIARYVERSLTGQTGDGDAGMLSVMGWP